MLRETARLVLPPHLEEAEEADGMSSTTTKPSEPREESTRALLRVVSAAPPVSHDPEARPPYFEAALGMDGPASPALREDRNAVDGTTVDPTTGGWKLPPAPVMPLASCAVTAHCARR